MAEALFNKIAKKKHIDGVRAQSAGIYVAEGAPASSNAVAALSEIGIDLKHFSRQLTREMIHSSTAVYTMSPDAAELLKNAFPEDTEKISFLGKGIPDPFGGDIEIYRKCRDSILDAVKNIADKVK